MKRNDGHRRDSSRGHVTHKKSYKVDKTEQPSRPYYKTATYKPAHVHKEIYVERPLVPSGFTPMGLIEPLLRALQREGYSTPTPIQEQSIPALLEGRDLIGIAQTGTGKTAAFTLPLLQHITKEKRMPSRGRPRALILAPTRELAAQIGDSITAYGRYLHITHTVIYGGVGQRPQTDALGRGMDIVVATPGRLLDLMQQGFVQLDKIEVFILDEADRMFDMGFIHDIRKIITKIPPKRQTIFLSATMPPTIRQLAQALVHNPAQVSITPEKPTVDTVKQTVLFVNKQDKDLLLVSLAKNIQRAIVFTQMKHVANRVVEKLLSAGINAVAIHGNKSQTARTEALNGFKQGKVRVLVATDIAARGIDVDNITHVINYDLPTEPETYVHRIGRTARAGASGDALSFCTPEERGLLRDIEKLLHREIPVDTTHGFHSEIARNASTNARPIYGGRGGQGGGHQPQRGFRPKSHFGPPRRRR